MFEHEKSMYDEHSFGGSWTLIKLEALERYLVAFNNALSKQFFTRIYIDGFAGTGRCDIKVEGEKKSIDGSARRALGVIPVFHKYCFIEQNSKKSASLNSLQAEYPEKSIEIINDDANIALKIFVKAMTGENPEQCFSLIHLVYKWSG